MEQEMKEWHSGAELTYPKYIDYLSVFASKEIRSTSFCRDQDFTIFMFSLNDIPHDDMTWHDVYHNVCTIMFFTSPYCEAVAPFAVASIG